MKFFQADEQINTTPLTSPDKVVYRKKQPMTPNTRKRKSYVANEITEAIVSACGHLPLGDQVEAIQLSLSNLGLLKELIEFNRKPTKAGRKLTPLEVRRVVWNFWHSSENTSESTLTSRPAKIRVENKPHIQVGLTFADTVEIITQRNHNFYQGQWKIINLTCKELYSKYLKANPDNYVSWGTFTSLRPFYVRSATTKDIEVCCCKLHLHARWSIKSLIQCCKKQNIDLDFTDYQTFFEFLTRDCEKDENAYVSWDCTPDKRTVCKSITNNWQKFVSSILQNSSADVAVPFSFFSTTAYLKKNNQEGKRLEAVHTSSNLFEITEFITEMMPKIIHHRNQLKNYRAIIHTFREHHNAVLIDIDFSEKLKVPIKFQAQSQHWNERTVIVHSGIMHDQGVKSYHAYLSDDKYQDQAFVNNVLEKMLQECHLEKSNTVVIESDNCSSQYKCSEHFHSLLNLATTNNVVVIRIFGIAGHGKGEVDHVGGLAKVTIRREVAAEKTFTDSADMIECLKEKFGDKESPLYFFKEVEIADLEVERAKSKLKVFHTVAGSSSFQVMVFRPNSSIVKASPRLCMCASCMVDFGSCALFKEYPLVVQTLNKVSTRSNFVTEPLEIDTPGVMSDLIFNGSIVAVAAEERSPDTVWFIIIDESKNVCNNEVVDGYGNKIPPRQHYLSGRFLERSSISETLHIASKKTTFFYKETIVYPCVQVTCTKKGYEITKEELCEILAFVQDNGMSRL